MIEAYILLIIGAIAVLAALMGKLPGKQGMWIGLGVGVVLVYASLVPMGIWDEWQAEDAGIIPSTVSGVKFAVTPVCGSSDSLTSTLNSDEDGFTVPALGNWTGTTHTVVQTDNTTYVNPSFKFTIEPVPFTGADADDLATVFVDIIDADHLIQSSTSTYYLISKSGNKRQALVSFNSGSQTYKTGSDTMLMTGQTVLYVNLTLNTDSFGHIDSTFSPETLRIRLYNDANWYETYDLDFVLTDSWGTY